MELFIVAFVRPFLSRSHMAVPMDRFTLGWAITACGLQARSGPERNLVDERRRARQRRIAR